MSRARFSPSVLSVPTLFVIGACAALGCTPTSSVSGSGGATASGGHVASGGSSASGGSTATGSGGISTSSGTGGESSSTGGAGTGGRGTGGAASGGTGGTGGSIATGGAASDASATGGASVDAGTDTMGGPAGCMGMFCEDFESGKLDPNIWNIKTSGGQMVTVQKNTVAHGTYAAQFHALPNVLSYDLIITKNAPTGLQGHHFGRAYFYVTPKPPDQHTTLLFAASAGFPTFKRLELSTIHAGWQLTSVNQTGINSNSAALSGTTETYSAGGNVPVQKWICVEWEFNDTPDQIRVFVDGKEDFAFTNITLGGKTSGQVGGFVDFGFGYYIWHPATYVFDVFYDDIVLDTKRVGCLP